MTVYAVADIHGMRYKLAKALAYLRATLDGDDYTVFLGDYIDRGPDSRGVIDDLLEFAAERPETIFLRGNHEEWMLNCYYGARSREWLHWGGIETLQSYGVHVERNPRHWQDRIPASHLEFLSNLKIDHRTEDLWFVHAGLVPNIHKSGSWTPDLWIRDEFIEDDSDFGRLVVFGHTPQILPSIPLILPNKVCLDTGAAYGGVITVAGFDESRSYHDEISFSIYQGLVEEDYLLTRCDSLGTAVPLTAPDTSRYALEGAA